VSSEQWAVSGGHGAISSEQWPRPRSGYSPVRIASIATLHHLALREVLLKMKAALKPGGVLLILDLFEPTGVVDTFLNPPAIAVSAALRLIHHGRLLPSREARDAWATHESHDLYPTMTRIRELCAEILPGARVRKHLLWRYSVIWRKV
jgi:SAM-dependent methyltransferase